ncbi:MAG: chalcone isomerase family protein [Parachlamydiaceae bacterium]
MKQILKYLFFICLSCHPLIAEEKVTSCTTGVSFPKEIAFTSHETVYHMQLTGIATRTKFFIKIYSIASYLEKDAFSKGPLLEEIMNDHWGKQLSIQWIHDAGSQRVKHGYLEAFQNALPRETLQKLQPEIQLFLSFFKKDMRVGDILIFRWLPGGHFEFLINEEVSGTIDNIEFVKALWSLWFESKNIVNRDNLLHIN